MITHDDMYLMKVKIKVLLKDFYQKQLTPNVVMVINQGIINILNEYNIDIRFNIIPNLQKGTIVINPLDNTSAIIIHVLFNDVHYL